MVSLYSRTVTVNCEQTQFNLSYSSDELMSEFQELARAGEWEAAGWPNCAYTASKVGVNVYTRWVP